MPAESWPLSKIFRGWVPHRRWSSCPAAGEPRPPDRIHGSDAAGRLVCLLLRRLARRDRGRYHEPRRRPSSISMRMTASPSSSGSSAGQRLYRARGGARGADRRGRLRLVHVHHHLRGDSADGDAEAVQRLARRLGASAEVVHADVSAYMKAHALSKSVAARYARYQLLGNAAARVGQAAVLVAHTSSDILETLLLNILRGSEVRGLVGISPRTYPSRSVRSAHRHRITFGVAGSDDRPPAPGCHQNRDGSFLR